jgi:DNA-binding protein HU-beta
MNKTELVKEIAVRSELTQKDSGAALNAFIETVEEALVNGDSVLLMGFGKFQTKKANARIGVNPQNQEKIEIPAKVKVGFKPGKELKVLVNG